MMYYGFQRLALLNSAKYKKAEIPLDASVSLAGANNIGKTTLINALQFLLIIDQRRMDFGHSLEKTKEFYFPSNSSYILLEVYLPQTGTVVFGCVGRGVANDYEYFIYKGELSLEDYRDTNNNLVTQNKLLAHLSSLGKTPYRYNSTEFASLIYGGQNSSRKQEFTVFKLENFNDAKVFQQVLTRTLRLEKLTSDNVKDYLLQIFKRDLSDANIDFKQEWEKAFKKVNSGNKRYQVALDNYDKIQELEKDYADILELRGKLQVWRHKLDDSLIKWQDFYLAETSSLDEIIKVKKAEQNQRNTTYTQCLNEQHGLEINLSDLTKKQERLTDLAREFALIEVNNLDQIETEKALKQKQLDRLTATLLQAQNYSLSSLKTKQQNLLRQLTQVLNQQKNFAHNLFQELSQNLNPQELGKLNKLFNSEVMMLAPEDYQIDLAKLRDLLAASSEDSLQIAGLDLSLSKLTPQFQQKTFAELEEEAGDLEKQLADNSEEIKVAESLEAHQQTKHNLEKEILAIQQSLDSFAEMQGLQATEEERLNQIKDLETKLLELVTNLADFDIYTEKLDKDIRILENQNLDLQQRNINIDSHKNFRQDNKVEFNLLSDLPCTVWVAEGSWDLDELPVYFDTYNKDCSRLLDLNSKLNNTVKELQYSGLTSYMYDSNPDEEVKQIISFTQQLEKEKLALEKAARTAVINVASSLRSLRDGLLEFQKRLRDFNRLIGHRKLSDLAVFKIEALEKQDLVEAINILIDKAQTADTGESFELFNQASVLDDTALDRAKQKLIEEGEARNGLRVADLFSLQFILGKEHQESESFEDLDSAASNGTVLMAKLVTGLAMLYLMQDKNHKLNAICYLDEALALDKRNQESLIETAREFGFVLIFASPAPLTTVRYIVPVMTRESDNYIAKDAWQVIEKLEA